MQVTILVFGQLTDIIHDSPFTIQDVRDTDQLVQELQERFPALTGMPYNIAVEKQIIGSNTPLSNNNTVALLPPFAGG